MGIHADILRDAMNRIKDKKSWCSGSHAKRVVLDGDVDCDPLADDACKWCADGSLLKSVSILADRGSWRVYYDCIEFLDLCCRRRYGDLDFIDVNDSEKSTSHREIISIFRMAIKEAQKW